MLAQSVLLTVKALACVLDPVLAAFSAALLTLLLSVAKPPIHTQFSSEPTVLPPT